MSKIWCRLECETINQDEKSIVCGYVNCEYNNPAPSPMVDSSGLGGMISEPPKSPKSK